MMLAASQRRFDLLLFWKLDRLSVKAYARRWHISHDWMAGESHGRSFTEQHLDSAGIFKDVVISIMATLAEEERISISERTKAGLIRARRSGNALGPREVRVDMTRVRRLQREGHGLRTIAERLGCSVNTLQVRLGKLNYAKYKEKKH
jgi:DNA invertase Pin-like site-specific DNA recombinase